ncbi:MAG: hypothetical protein DRP71_03920 [Verrucomicrobia bacterium]|nr:MAG: hypothetical protein DRP71_03920 [Verrucomicrobiota bacterium]
MKIRAGMKTRFLKTLAVIFTLGIAIVAGYAAILLNPGPLFEYKVTIAQIDVLSDHPIGSEVTDVIAKVSIILRESELYDPEFEMRVLLTRDHVYNRLSRNRTLAYAVGPNAALSGEIDGARNILYRETSPVRMNLVSTLSHELIHCLQWNHHGVIAFNKALPRWKREGYAEYVALGDAKHRESYSIAESLDRLLAPDSMQPVKGWITTEDGFDRPILYCRFRLMTEYLLDVEGLSYERFVDEATERDDVYNRMITWHKKNSLRSQGGDST